ncbi:MAG TPA: hypothetical protein VHF01_05040 [Candidatus Acidoferrum sp.]|nr:hypothetical protein [Candidatus Acidoferrum sp.]
MLSLGSNRLLPLALFAPRNKGVTNRSENQLLPTVANPADAGQSNEKLELHTIAIDDGHEKVSRTPGIGKFGDKEETIPPDFSSIEDELKRLRDFAFPAEGKPCHLAPVIKNWQ